MWLLLACAPDPVEKEDTAATPPGLAPVEVVHVTTEDGIALEGDYYAAEPGDPGVLLLHMSPLNGYDRTVWPAEFIGDLRADGFAVLALDRRGAGGSEGDPADAAGEPGVWDARAAVDYLIGAGMGGLSVVGGSSGTTTTLDYAVTAAEAGYPVPTGLVFMSPGSYTEAQHDLSELTNPSLMLTYPESEASWNEGQMATAPATWRFEEYAGSAHAALILPDNPTVAADIRAWLRGEGAAGTYVVE